MNINSVFVLLLGPSGVGKSSIIEKLIKEDSRFVPSFVYTNRAPRENDFGRISISDKEFKKMSENGEFLIEAPIYGNKYAIPIKPVMEALKKGKIPIQDFPESFVEEIRGKISLLTIYTLPPSLETLRQRLQIDGRDPNGARHLENEKELNRLKELNYKTPTIDDVVVNDNLDEAVERVLEIISKRVNL